MEVRRLVEEARQRAEKILHQKREQLELLTRALIEYETLTRDEMEKVLRGDKLDKLELSSPSPSPSSTTKDAATPLKLPDALNQAPKFNRKS